MVSTITSSVDRAEFQANLEAIFTLCRTLFQLDSIICFVLYAFCSFLAIIAPAWINNNGKNRVDFESVVTRNSSLDDNHQHEFSQRNEGGSFLTDDDYLTADDAEYAENMQLHEALLASIFSSTTLNNEYSSVEEPNFGTEQVDFNPEVRNPSYQVFCEICLENKDSSQMFKNEKCSHSFCSECTTSHIISKIQDGVESIRCPALNCSATLNSEACRQMIPKKTLVKWDEFLCLSLIPESSKLYCPFRDCLAMLVNDSGLSLREVNCVSCKRTFCAECRVPWHTEFTCKEFQKLYVKKKGGKDDKIVKTLAKKKNWQKCPKCKVYVEKAEGCMHMTCRCKHQFCYKCGSKWSDSHANSNCRQR